MSEFLHLITDPPHLAFELVTDLVFAGAGAIWVRLHDRKHHKRP